MKKILASVAAVGCLVAAGTAIAGLPAATGVNGSLHDMTRVVPSTADEMGRVCVYCHTPHHAIKDEEGVDNYPLWNHNLVDDNNYVAYTWATPANAVTDLEILDPLMGPSRLCMSCHDGAIAIDQHGEAMASVGANTTISNRAKLTNDLSNTHPIGFNYIRAAEIRNAKAGVGSATAGGATEIVPATYGFATGITITANGAANQGDYNVVTRNDGTNSKLIQDVLYAGTTMTCASCHEVHNKENAVQDNFRGTQGQDVTKAPNYFLYAKQTDSLICLSCHVK